MSDAMVTAVKLVPLMLTKPQETMSVISDLNSKEMIALGLDIAQSTIAIADLFIELNPAVGPVFSIRPLKIGSI